MSETLSKDEDMTEVTPEQPPEAKTMPDCRLEYVKRNGQYHLRDDKHQLKNSLLIAVGFFELANCGDFAANVWNTIPVPRFAIALMAVGATFALCMTYFAYRDARLSWNNLHGLRCERSFLLRKLRETAAGEDQRPEKNEDITRTVNALLDLNFREMGTEIVDRLGLDIFMGFGAVLVGVGTFMAIGGANHRVYIASNLLSGYIGNAPLALFGLANLGWSIYLWMRGRRHHISYRQKLLIQPDADPTVEKLLKTRINDVNIHSALSGVTGVVSGAASLVTATMWWGYVILIPCILASVMVNYLFRHEIGYDRPLLTREVPALDQDSLTVELKYIASIRSTFVFSKKKPSITLSDVVSHPKSLSSILAFMTENNLLEDFYIRLLNKPDRSSTVFDLSQPVVTISSRSLLSVSDESVRRRIIEVAEECIINGWPMQIVHRSRYLAELLGCYLTASSATPGGQRPAETMV